MKIQLTTRLSQILLLTAFAFVAVFAPYKIHEIGQAKEAVIQEKSKQIEQLQDQVKALQSRGALLKAHNEGWVTYEATFYSAEYASTGKNPGDPSYGITASGRRVQEGVTVAVDSSIIPLGSWIAVKFPDGSVRTYRADDTGSAIKGNRLDIYVSTDAIARQYGRKTVQVKILSVGDQGGE